MEPIAAAVVSKSLAHLVGRQDGYLCNYKFNLEYLVDEVDGLKLEMRSVQRKVEEAKRHGEEIRSDVVYWLEDAEWLIADAGRLIEEMRAERGCFKGLCPNLTTRYKLSKEARRRGLDIAILCREVRFREVVYTTIEKESTYVVLESRNRTLMNIVMALNNDNIHMVEIYGISGIGKTTLAKQVEVRVRKDEFDEVVFVEITRTPNVKKIQEVIADQLDLRFNNENGRASQLYERLKNGKKILLILDDIWDVRGLGTIGIPSTAVDLGGCKLLLTTRENRVLPMMGSESFKIGFLNKDEAWKLFKNMTGDYIEDQKLESIQTDMVGECFGLPGAIVPLGKALRNYTKRFEWRETLGKIFEWKEALFEQPPGDISEVLYSARITIEFSCNSLIGDELKKTFVLCSLMQNDASVLDLLKYVIGLDILEGKMSKMEDARRKLGKVVRKIKDSCLLHDGRTSEHFSMHEIVRNVATSIAQKDHHVVIKRGDPSGLSLDKDNLKKCKNILLIDEPPPKELEFSKLEFFYMSNKDNTFEIDGNFFSKMPTLKVLHLIGMQLSPLPSSALHHLVELQTLCLECSKLDDITIIGKLQKLKILSLQGSDIKKLPKEIGQLTQLWLLDLTDCSSLEVIAADVISGLSGLEELYMMNCSVRWEAKDVDGERSNACLEDLTSLSRLTTLEINIKDVNIFPTQIFFKKLERYKIFIGDSWHVNHGNENSRILKLQLNSGIYLDKLQHMTNVEVLHLKTLTSSSHEIISVNEHDEQRVDFHNLKALTLSEIDVENIWDWHLGTISFGYKNLTSLIVKNCLKLKSLFSLSEAKCLERLQHFEISECTVLQEIVARGAEEEPVIFVFSRVTFLRLWAVPELKTFYPGKHTLEWPMLKKFETDNDIEMKKVVFPHLFEQKDSDDEKIDWENRVLITYSRYQILTELVVTKCRKLKSVFSDSIVNLLVQLRRIEISECIALQDIVEKEGFGKPSLDIVFPRLTIMKLWKLPKLRTFYPGIHVVKLPMLEKLQIGYCDKVSAFGSKYVSFYENNDEGSVDVDGWEPQPLFLAKKINPNLKELTLGGNNTKCMSEDQLRECHFGGLKVLRVKDDK